MTANASGIAVLFRRVLGLRQELYWVFMGQFIGFAGGFIGLKVLTNIMDPKGYGQLALGLTIAGIFTTYVYGPVANVVARFFAVYRERCDLGVYFATIRNAHRTLGLALALLALIASGIAGMMSGNEWALIVLFASFFGIVSGVNASFLALQNAVRQRKIVAIHQGIDVWLRIGLAIALILLFKSSGYLALLGYLLGTTLITFSQFQYAKKNDQIRSNWKADNNVQKLRACNSEFRAYAASFMIFSGFAAISLYSDRWVLQAVSGEHAVGIYAALYQIAASPVNLFFAMINQMVVPIVFERAGAMTSKEQAESSAQLVTQTAVISGVVMTGITLCTYFFGEPITQLLTNKTFAEQSSVLWLVVVGISIYNIGQIYTLKGLYHNQPKIYFWPKGLQAVSFLITAFLLARQTGIEGVGMALCISSVLYLSAVLFSNSRLAPV
jgi:O-antigen/teichoic acid export membrane protein